MTAKEHLNHIHRLARHDGRYAPDAFLFVSEAIAHTVNWVRDGTIQVTEQEKERGDKDEFHVSGQELLRGVRKLARERWGCMARTVLEQWGVRKTDDFGEIVFLMVEDEELRWKKRECDRREDFANGYDFETAFDDIGE